MFGNISSVNSSTCNQYFDVEYQQCVSFEDVTGYLWDYLKPEWYELVLIILFIIVFISGIIGNFLVCSVIWRHRDMRTVTNMFILNLTVADLLVLFLVLFPSMIQDIFESWLFTAVGCKLLKYIQRVCVVVSILTLTVISVERYFAISNPLKFKSTTKRARTIIAMVWLLALIVSVPDLYYYNSFPDTSFPPGVTWLLATCRHTDPRSFIWFYFYTIALFAIPFCIMGICYIRIGRCLWSSQVNTLTAIDCGDNPGVTPQLVQRRKIARMLIVVVVTFFLCYLPHFFVAIYVRHNVISVDLRAALVTVGHLMVYVNSAVNPIIYNFMSEKFREAFHATCHRRHLKPDGVQNTNKPTIENIKKYEETRGTLV